jgi:2-aminoethylphosphonate-pyruvate transaminase
MKVDLGSRDLLFREITQDIRSSIQGLANAGQDYSVVLLQGSGTFAIEAALTTFVKAADKVLVCVNGVYGELAVKILRRHALDHEVISRPITRPVPVQEVEARLAADPGITHLYFVHCETTSGLLNPLQQLVDVARRRGVATMVDSMSAFGAIDVDAQAAPFDILISSGNKSLEAPPGIAFAIVRRSLLTAENTVARTYTLDLFDQWRNFEATGEWRSTPPTHIAQALHAGLRALRTESVAGRRARYSGICARTITGMRKLGFEPILAPELQTPICVAFRSKRLIPDAAAFAAYYQHLREAGLFIYSKFHPESASFRVGCIGQIEPEWVDDFLEETARFARARALPAGIRRRSGARWLEAAQGAAR